MVLTLLWESTQVRIAVPEKARQAFNFIREELRQYKINERTALNLLALASTFNGDEGAAAAFSLATAFVVSDLLKKVAASWSEATCQSIRDKLIQVNNGLDQMPDISF